MSRTLRIRSLQIFSSGWESEQTSSDPRRCPSDWIVNRLQENKMQLILTLRPPSKAVLTPEGGNENLLIDGTPAWGGVAPWASCPDLLYESTSRVLCGVAYGIHESYRAQVKDLFRLMDHRISGPRHASMVPDLPVRPIWQHGRHCIARDATCSTDSTGSECVQRVHKPDSNAEHHLRSVR